jgi:hypothetical protein
LVIAVTAASPGAVGDLAGEAQADQKRTDRGHNEGNAEHPQHDLFGLGVRQRPSDPVSPTAVTRRKDGVSGQDAAEVTAACRAASATRIPISAYHRVPPAARTASTGR